MDGKLWNAILVNPLGVVIATGLLVIPLWSIWDLSTGRRTLLNSFFKAERILRKRWVAVPLIILVLANWIWNIIKGL